MKDLAYWWWWWRPLLVDYGEALMEDDFRAMMLKNIFFYLHGVNWIWRMSFDIMLMILEKQGKKVWGKISRRPQVKKKGYFLWKLEMKKELSARQLRDNESSSLTEVHEGSWVLYIITSEHKERAFFWKISRTVKLMVFEVHEAPWISH